MRSVRNFHGKKDTFINLIITRACTDENRKIYLAPIKPNPFNELDVNKPQFIGAYNPSNRFPKFRSTYSPSFPFMHSQVPNFRSTYSPSDVELSKKRHKELNEKLRSFFSHCDSINQALLIEQWGTAKKKDDAKWVNYLETELFPNDGPQAWFEDYMKKLKQKPGYKEEINMQEQYVAIKKNGYDIRLSGRIFKITNKDKLDKREEYENQKKDGFSDWSLKSILEDLEGSYKIKEK